MNTNYSTIAEIRSWIHRAISNVNDQLKRIDETDPNYQWLVDRLEYLKKHSAKYEAMTGQALPKPRDRSNLKHYNKPRAF